MADLGQVIGTLLVSLAHARRMADEQTAAIAEQYRDNPLLQGMTIPRVRVPEFVAELPLVFEKVEDPSPPVLNEPAKIQAEAASEFLAAANDLGLKVPNKVMDQWKPNLLRRITDAAEPKAGAVGTQPSREHITREVQESLLQHLQSSELGAKIDAAARATLVDRVRKRVAQTAMKDLGKPAAVRVSVLTSEVKEKADPQSVSRIRLVMREEGLEWGEVKNPDGSTVGKLTPE